MVYDDLKNRFRKKRISLIYVFYWIMLAYIVAALIFWFIALDIQNKQITRFKTERLDANAPGYEIQLRKISEEERRKTFQYVGEGLTFLILIFAGAVLVFRMLRKQLRISKQQKDFMMAITHELKTPIAVAKLNLETLQKRNLDIEQRQKLILTSLAETDRLNALCNNMLLLNEMDAIGYALTKEDVLLNDVVAECIKEHNSRSPDRELRVDVSEDLHVFGDRMLLKLALNNLIDNAIKYSPKNSTVYINGFNKSNQVILQVIDEGEGIAAKEIDLIFEKFYRGSKRKAKGTGLGLYVTRQIIHQNKGTLKVSSNKPTGSIFTISFATKKSLL